MNTQRINPYLKEGRLTDVLAAITALANYRYYKLSLEQCAERIENNPERTEYWGEVFKEHPEFFRASTVTIDKKKINAASLVWRRQKFKMFNPKTGKTLERDDYVALNNEGKNKLSRSPLTTQETTALLDIAIKLHERAIEQDNRSIWRHPLFLASVGFGGAIIGAYIGAGM